MRRNSIFALESSTDSILSKETEITIYSKISLPEGLDKNSGKEQQHQVECRFITGDKSRVRKTIKDGQEKIEFTFKIKDKSEEQFQKSDELTRKVDQHFLDNYRRIAEQEMIKTRYVFHSENVILTLQIDGESKQISLPNVKYEVDVFNKADGSISEWCKIDVEIDNILNFIEKEYKDIGKMRLVIKVSHLPFKPKESKLGSDPANKAFIENLWQTEFVRKLRDETQ